MMHSSLCFALACGLTAILNPEPGSPGWREAPESLSSCLAVRDAGRLDCDALPTYSWTLFMQLLDSLDSILYPAENARSSRTGDVPLDPLQLLAESHANVFVTHYRSNGIRAGLRGSELADVDLLSEDLVRLLDREPGIISPASDHALRAALEEIRDVVLKGARHAGSL